jgi:hypothetical protein
MSVTWGSFVEQLLAEVPEAEEVVSEHLSDNGELLIHLLMADLLRFTVQAFHTGQSDVVMRTLDFMDKALLEGDEAVENAVAVSFVEHVEHVELGLGEGEAPAFLAMWPRGLLAEKATQDGWTPGG